MDSRFSHITHVFLDADDTLWENDIYYRKAEKDFVEYMSAYVSPETAEEQLAIHQEENIPIFGYGSKTYLLGMLDTAALLAPEHYGPKMYFDIKKIIADLSIHQFAFLDGAEETVKALARKYRVVIATKGEICEQMRKFRTSGLNSCVTAIETMERKSSADYRNLAVKMGIEPRNFFMVGNSVRSDIAPVVQMGGWAVYIPYEITWVHEVMPLPESPRIIQLQNIRQLGELLL